MYERVLDIGIYCMIAVGSDNYKYHQIIKNEFLFTYFINFESGTAT